MELEGGRKNESRSTTNTFASVRENARRGLALRAPPSCRGTASSPQPQPIDRRRHARGRHRSPQPSQRLQELFNHWDTERVPDERVPLRRRQRRRGGVPARHSHQALLPATDTGLSTNRSEEHPTSAVRCIVLRAHLLFRRQRPQFRPATLPNIPHHVPLRVHRANDAARLAVIAQPGLVRRPGLQHLRQQGLIERRPRLVSAGTKCLVRLTSANVGSSAAGSGRNPRGGRFDQKYRSRLHGETSQARCNAPDRREHRSPAREEVCAGARAHQPHWRDAQGLGDGVAVRCRHPVHILQHEHHGRPRLPHNFEHARELPEEGRGGTFQPKPPRSLLHTAILSAGTAAAMSTGNAPSNLTAILERS